MASASSTSVLTGWENMLGFGKLASGPECSFVFGWVSCRLFYRHSRSWGRSFHEHGEEWEVGSSSIEKKRKKNHSKINPTCLTVTCLIPPPHTHTLFRGPSISPAPSRNAATHLWGNSYVFYRKEVGSVGRNWALNCSFNASNLPIRKTNTYDEDSGRC